MNDQARDFDQTYTMNVGWGHQNPNLQQPYDVKCHPSEYKNMAGEEQGRLFIYTNGFQSQHTDKKYGVSFEDIKGLSIRQQREIFKRRAREVNEMNKLKYQMRNKSPLNVTYPSQ